MEIGSPQLRTCSNCGDTSIVGPAKCRSCGHEFHVTITRNPEARGWKKALAIFGIVAAFPLFLTITGWIALGSYRKWRDGDQSNPTFAWVMSGVGLGLIPLIILGSIIRAHEETPEERAAEALGGSAALSTSDEEILYRLGSNMTQWNGSLLPLVRDYRKADVSTDEWLREAADGLQDLRGTGAAFQAGTVAIQDDGLRKTFQPIGRIWHEEIGALTQLRNAVIDKDLKAEKAARARLQNALREQQRWAFGLLDRLRDVIPAEELDRLLEQPTVV